MSQVASVLLLLLATSMWPGVSHADTTACAANFTLLQRTQTTPAKVIGAPSEHLAMLAYHPQYDAKVGEKPANMYLLTGDKVDVIAKCDDYAYVRYQGHKLVSTGWVKKTRLQDIGASHMRPRDTVAEACAAAANTVNKNDDNWFYLTRVQQAPMSATMKEKAIYGDDDVGHVDGMSKVMVNGNAFDIFTIEGQGTASSNYLRIWTSNLSKLIADTDSSLGFGDGQVLVQVLGHPLVLRVHYKDDTKFSLSRIGKNGRLHVVCDAEMVYAPKPIITFGYNNPVCKMVLDNRVAIIAMHADRNSITILPPKFASNGPHRFKLSGIARVDLFNDGNTRNIGLVNYSGYWSDPFGGYPTFVTFPVVLGASKNIDLSNSVNKQLITDVTGLSSPGQFFQVQIGGRLVKYSGRTYFAMYDESNVDGVSLHTISGVLSFTPNGTNHICSFQPNEFIVSPTDGIENEVLH